ncbi:MAG TPA: amino acid ABC transporter substrate-binding protein [Ruminococcaceae bacterium]|nr:amino acid ABC transporter substrate-binding protein [Oscillospiraceae bacterium]
MKKVLAVLLALVLVIGLFAGCSADNQKTEEIDYNLDDAFNAVSFSALDISDDDINYIKEKGTLVVGITDFEPMDYKDANGNWIGFDADMATAFAKWLGVKVQFVEIDWDNKIFELDGKSIDCVWNGMTLTDEVKAAMATSNAYCNNAQVVIVSADKADQYNTVEACKELVFAVEAGSAGAEVAAENGFKVTEVKDQATTLMEVSAGTCDAAIIDKLMAAAMVGEGTSYAKLTYTVDLNSEEYGVGFRKDSKMADALNEFLKQANANGLTQVIAEQYGVQAAIIK